MEEERKAADLGIQESHLVGLVQSNRRMGRLTFFHRENQTLSKYYLECKGVILLKHCVYLTTAT